ncbi:MFS transporter [Sphingomonas sp.]|uniref:MFS transporter n=1 Tax=Sphingomonas sp. TaxID=28214 RepID=UPI0025D3B4CB|nr:MFS transporter [Sphingomonas sp.]
MRRWLVLSGCFVGMALSTPAILMQPLGLFLKSMTAEFGWSRTTFSSVVALAALANIIILPIAGYLVDRFGPRRVIAIGAVLGGIAYASLALANSYGELIGLIMLAVATGNLASYPAFMALAQRWFHTRLGFALAITSTGLAVGVAIFSFAISQIIAVSGWRAAFALVGFTVLVIGLLNVVFLVRDFSPPAADINAAGGNMTAVSDSETFGMALRSRDFWLYTSAFTLIIFGVVGCNFHLPALLADRGAVPGLIATVVAVGAAGSLFGRLTTGLLLDRYSVICVAIVFFTGQAISFLLLLDGLTWALPASFLLGAVQGAEVDVLGYVLARRFGPSAYARIFGTCFGITLIGAIIGPMAMAAIFDRTGSYDLGLLLLPVLPTVALLLLTRVRPLSVTAG